MYIYKNHWGETKVNKLVELYNKIPADKIGHLTLGLLFGLAFGQNLVLAIVLILIVALGKEIYDYVHNKITKTETHGVELLDATATIAGGVIGLAVVYLLNILI